MKAPLILMISERMNKNRSHKDRPEHTLIRMGAAAREALGLTNEKTVEVWADGDIYDKVNRSRVLSIYEAFAKDLAEIKEKINTNQLSPEDYVKIAFVTRNTFEFLCKNPNAGNKIWLADSLTDLIIGSDPEFALLDSKNTLITPALSHLAELGSDGNLVEVRARPATTSAEHVKAISEIFKTHPNAKVIEEYTWKAGCYVLSHLEGTSGRTVTQGHAVGGHIHIGTPVKLAKIFAEGTSNLSSEYVRVMVLSVLKKILDEYVSIPLMNIEGITNSVSRRSHYGKLTDVRVDFGRLEFRTPGGDWLAHPKLAEAVLDVTKAVAHAFFMILEENNNNLEIVLDKEIINDLATGRWGVVGYLLGIPDRVQWDKNSKISQIMGATLPSKTLGTMLEAGAPKITKEFLENIHRLYRELPVYKEYERNIEIFNEIAGLPPKTLAGIDRDLKNTWLAGDSFII